MTHEAAWIDEQHNEEDLIKIAIKAALLLEDSISERPGDSTVRLVKGWQCIELWDALDIGLPDWKIRVKKELRK